MAGADRTEVRGPLFAALSLAFFFGTGPASAAPLYQLVQVSYHDELGDDCIAFIDAGQDGARFTSGLQRTKDINPYGGWGDIIKEEVHGSNTLVFASGGFVQAVSGIDAWVDIKGHVHTLVALRSQGQFNRWLRAHAACPSGCELTGGRAATFRIRPVLQTGILDKDTSMIPLMRLELRYDRAYNAFLKDCRIVAPRGCDAGPWPNGALAYWANTLDRARRSLDDMSAALAEMPFVVPAAPTWRNTWQIPAPGNPYGGLEHMFTPSTNGRQSVYFFKIEWGNEKGEGILIYPKGDEPGTTIETSADPRAIGAGTLERIELTQQAAEAAVAVAESLAPPSADAGRGGR